MLMMLLVLSDYFPCHPLSILPFKTCDIFCQLSNGTTHQGILSWYYISEFVVMPLTT
jgi:hypothetical protein